MKPLQLPSFTLIGTMVIELREFNDKKKKKKKKHDLCCKIIKSEIELKLKARSELPNLWGEYKNHSNPYIQGTTVPCDVHVSGMFVAVPLNREHIFYMYGTRNLQLKLEHT